MAVELRYTGQANQVAGNTLPALDACRNSR
jgi:hypothetical protein